ncbi:hypothetical protein A6C57_23505 [Fibrella sp. ES10-3-2-2]|nr:hypothetical protein A6C57_23505 [Fibrella sp. ES10-3-2-2]
MELRTLRDERPSLLLSAGYHKGYKAKIDSVVSAYAARRAFLGIGNRRQKRKLVQAINRIP